ncbi:hypothetical protein WOLCODRAFT_142749 [Wolfiporia cocos MD-104 SS10]|uniref:Uncharacterized protein n=1 Tax=Wolfiporia cocos (strain MD-104) TaxID=742152 RepID=A0A2H3JIM3_WOLCO|nr:hypothetical protein WOLCODRAFT_142749 [Wolfiporia cocos MD-104 SS10]
MPPTPSSIIADALNSLSKAANLALATVEEQARADVAAASAEASEACRERDNALKALQAAKLKQKEREERWKAAVDKAEQTISEQHEAIEHLRAEAKHWKSRFVALEETSSQEIADWRERYLSAEQERCRLSSRADELAAEQLARDTAANSAALPRSQYSDYHDTSTSSTSTKRASTVSRAGTLAKASASRDLPSAARAPSRGSRRKTQADADPASDEGPSYATRPSSKLGRKTPSSPKPAFAQRTQSAVQQRVVRRSTIVVTVPIKEEEKSDADLLQLDDSGSEDEPPSKRGRGAGTTTRRPPSRARRRDDEEAYMPRRLEYADDDVDELALSDKESAAFVLLQAGRERGPNRKRKSDDMSKTPRKR